MQVLCLAVSLFGTSQRGARRFHPLRLNKGVLAAVNVWDKIGWMEGRLSIKGLTGTRSLPICFLQPRPIYRRSLRRPNPCRVYVALPCSQTTSSLTGSLHGADSVRVVSCKGITRTQLCM